MKKFALALILGCFSFLSAFFVGQVGDPFESEGYSFQRMAIEHRDTVSIDLLGDPISGISNGWIYSFSEVDDLLMEMHTLQELWVPPQTAKGFVEFMTQEGAMQKEIFRQVESLPENALYGLEWDEESLRVRFYATKNAGYWLLVSQEMNEDMKERIFSSIEISE